MNEAIAYIFNLFYTDIYAPILTGLQTYALFDLSLPFGTGFTSLAEIMATILCAFLTGVILALPYWIVRIFKWVVK